MSIARYAYRSFDRQWTILDARLIDRPRPELRRAHSGPATLLDQFADQCFRRGPFGSCFNLIPDLHYFRGRGASTLFRSGKKRNQHANLTGGVLEKLQGIWQSVPPKISLPILTACCFRPTLRQSSGADHPRPAPADHQRTALLKNCQLGRN